MAAVAVATKIVHDPRDYQRDAIDAGRRDLEEKGGALIVVPTGGGKSLIMGYSIDEEIEAMPDARILVLQHTGELLTQNLTTISGIVAHRDTTVSVVKSKANDWDGQIIFGCTPTIQRKKRRAQMPYITHLVVDEGHRLGTASCKLIISDLRAVNPNLKILTCTATPNRGDGQTLEYAVGEGCSYQITYADLIDRGVLVPPRTFTIDLGLNDEIESLPKVKGDYDMETIGNLLNREVHNEAVFEHWLERASDRQTLGFCPTVEHAQAMAATFRANGIVAEAVWGDMDADLRFEILERFEAGTIQVVFNCQMLTEGYDAPRISCIIILRPMVEEITFLQSIGRGLRSLDELTYPGESKANCILLDFTGATQVHGTLELRIQSEREAKLRSINPPKAELDNVIDMKPAKKKLRDFTMREINLITDVKQQFIFTNTVCENAVAHNNYAWAGAFCFNGEWHAIARIHNQTCVHLGHGDRLDVVRSIDMFLRNEASGRMPKDLREGPMTLEQRRALRRWLVDHERVKNRYEAMCLISVLKAQKQIQALLMEHQPLDLPLAA